MRPLRWLALAAVALSVVAGACGIVLWWWWAGSIPPRAGSFRLTGLSEAVRVSWDPRGVPTVEARTFEDALAAEGWLHGRYRPMQVELRRRAANGRVAEVAGAALLWMDREALTSGFTRAAEAELRAMAPATRHLLDAYVAGLNAGLAETARRLPPELRLLRVDPSPWTAADVLAFGRLFGSELSAAASCERERFDLLTRMSPEDAATLWRAAYDRPFPAVPGATRALTESLRHAPARTADLSGSASCGPLDGWAGLASNAWAVTPARSTTGGPILAGDPHLLHELPSVWFELRLRWPGGGLAGASLAGTPGVLIGHSDDIAWSFTAAAFDDADLFFAEVDDGERPTRYRENGAWKPFEIETQRVPVKGAEQPSVVEVRRAGPAVYVGAAGPTHAFLRRWVLDEAGGLVEGLLALDTARSTDAAIAAGHLVPGPPLNLIVAGRDGHVAHELVGRAPARRETQDWDGGVPAPWSGAGAWTGWVPDARMPLERDPASGFVASANDAGIAAAPPAKNQQPLTGDYDPAYRATRIRARLAAEPRWSPEQMADLQTDARAAQSDELREVVAACGLESPPAQLLRAWDATMRGPGAPLLAASFAGTLRQRLLRNTRLGRTTGNVFAGARAITGLLRTARTDAWIADWFDDPGTQWLESPCDQVRLALDTSWDALQRAAGPDPAAWSYEANHVVALRSPVGIGPLARWFNPPPFGQGGSGSAILAQAFHAEGPWTGKPYIAAHGPSYRIVAAFDGSGVVRSTSALPGGEDEHPASAHAFDRIADYAAGRQTPLIPPDPSNAEPLTLVP